MQDASDFEHTALSLSRPRLLITDRSKFSFFHILSLVRFTICLFTRCFYVSVHRGARHEGDGRHFCDDGRDHSDAAFSGQGPGGRPVGLLANAPHAGALAFSLGLFVFLEKILNSPPLPCTPAACPSGSRDSHAQRADGHLPRVLTVDPSSSLPPGAP